MFCLRHLKTRFVAAFAAAFILFSSFVFPAPVSADAAGNDDVKFDDTDVLEDLQSIEGFSIQNYPFYSSSNPEMYVINVTEYCYSFYDNLRDNYGLYLYVYNPNGLYIDTDNYGNCVQMAVKYDSMPITENSKPTDYEKFSLELCSVCSAPNYERLFYKFKVIDHASRQDGKTIAERVNSNARRYDISGIELVREGHSTAEEYPLTGKYSLDGKADAYGSFIFTGYAKGYGPDQNAESTLKGSVSKLETVQLDVKHTFYRTETSSKGTGFQNQIDTVYFSVPKRFFDNYGTLQRIKAEWYEYMTKPILVTSNKDYYDFISKYIGVRTDSVPDDFYFVTTPYQYKPEGYHPPSIFGTLVDGVGSAFDWLIPPGHNFTDYVNVMWNVREGYACQEDLSPLYYLFNTTGWCDIKEYDPYADDVEAQGGVNSNRLYEYIKSYNKTIEKGYLPIKNGRISADLFEDDINAARKMENERGKVQKGYSFYDFDASLDLQSWLSWSDAHDENNKSFWQKWRSYGFWDALVSDGEASNEVGRTVAPIQVIMPGSSELQLEDPQLSDELLINSKDVKEFRDTCNDAFTVDGKDDEEKYVVVFRFAVSDYYAEDVYLGEFKDNWWDGFETGQAYLAQETCFFDFDIIQLSFKKDEQWHVIAAVSNPIDIVNDITTPTNMSDKEPAWKKWLELVLALILVVILLIILWPVLPFILKAVVWIISLPFKLIAALVRKLFGKPKRRQEEPPQEDPDDKPKEKTTKEKSSRKR